MLLTSAVSQFFNPKLHREMSTTEGSRAFGNACAFVLAW